MEKKSKLWIQNQIENNDDDNRSESIDFYMDKIKKLELHRRKLEEFEAFVIASFHFAKPPAKMEEINEEINELINNMQPEINFYSNF
ncbi:hypothetical protein Glove_21g366 [Diversispora epigaea]|uniref:Uncharacterized protein n=1 Tax=Diversispora epigaea TaxID=1348612 RepID=A0A397JU99_9GLOM|nr:hypothetical protein Glove_21g366 [Diversispora epigaea]